ncbi:MAG: YfhO family protein [Clostridiales bacterium]|nr:YfhO family protein [Clostridiales bacterium]
MTVKSTAIYRTFSNDSTINKKLVYLTPDHPRYGDRTDFYINLGWSEENCQKITITFPKAGEYSLNSLEIYKHSLDNYENEVEKRKENILENVEIGTNQITGNISLNEKKLLCLTIPYSTGWTAFVDEEETELLRANTMFMALPLSAGNHQITMVYQTPGLNGGIGLTFIGLIMLVYLFALQKRKSKIQ